MDEEVDLGNISGTSLTSPISGQLPLYARAFDQSMDHDELSFDGGSPTPPAPIQRLDEVQPISPSLQYPTEEATSPQRPSSTKEDPAPIPSSPVVDGIPSLHRKIRITTEVERIVVRISTSQYSYIAYTLSRLRYGTPLVILSCRVTLSTPLGIQAAWEATHLMPRKPCKATTPSTV